jgi:hypothetical protein
LPNTQRTATQRPHRALQLRPLRPDSPIAEPVCGAIWRRPVLGGLVNEYEPAALTAASEATAEFSNPTPLFGG